MEIDLATLREMHPRLPADLVASIVVRAALGLQRNGHASGVKLDIDVARVQINGYLDWPTADIEKLNQHDHNRVTEDGAEAVALALVYARGSGELSGECSGRNMLIGGSKVRPRARQTIALEVSGVDRGPIGFALRRSWPKWRLGIDADQRWAAWPVLKSRRPALHAVEANDHGQ